MRPARDPLDHLLGMHFLVLDARLDVEVPEPRERSFIVVEEPVILPGADHVYVVVKRGLSTQRMLSMLARSLGVRGSCLTAAGLKDAKATTLQHVSLSARCMESPPARLRLPGRVWGRLLGAGRLARGLVKGNRFFIRLCGRDAARAGELLSGRTLTLPAYYGYQRFGTRRPNTHLVGLMMAWVDEAAAFREAVSEPYPDENPRIILSRLSMRPRISPEDAMARRSRRLGVARLSGVAGHGLLQLYASALQAFLFNEYISERVRLGYGLREPVEGERLIGGRPHAPVPGVDADSVVEGESRRILEAVLARHGLALEDLASLKIYGVAVKTFYRPVFFETSVTVTGSGGCVWLVFGLEKGMYASLVLREVCKNIHKCVY